MSTGDDLLEVLDATVAAVRRALDALPDWGPSGTKAGQYLSDLAADEAAVTVLEAAGWGVLSEESGRHHPERGLTAVLDPVDGSTNAARGLPWYATSVCVVDGDGPLAAVVVNQATGVRFSAVRGNGASCDGVALRPTGTTDLRRAFVGLSGFPGRHLGWKQYRALGAAALDICAVAAGRLDAYIDCSRDAHGPWDYLGGLLVCQEAGAVVADRHRRDLVTLGHDDRRTPIAAATPALLEAVLAAYAAVPE